MKFPIKTVIADIETSPCLAMVFKTGKQAVSIEQLIPDYFTKIICISWRWIGEKKTHRVSWNEAMDDKQLLLDFVNAVQGAECIIGHNEKSFDIKIINTRLAFHGIKETLPIMLIEDTLLLARRVFRLPSMKLSYLLQYFGIKKKKIKTDMGWWIDCCYYNDRDVLGKMGVYCDRDVDSLHDLYLKIRDYLPSTINCAIVNNNPELCPNCGHKERWKEGFRFTRVGKYQAWKCKKCFRKWHDGINLITGTTQYMR